MCAVRMHMLRLHVLGFYLGVGCAVAPRLWIVCKMLMHVQVIRLEGMEVAAGVAAIETEGVKSSSFRYMSPEV